MRVLQGHRGKLRAVVYSPDGAKLATAGDAGVTKLWDVATGRELASIPQPEARKQRVGHLAFTPDGRLLATATEFVRVWDLDTLDEVATPAGIGASGGWCSPSAAPTVWTTACARPPPRPWPSGRRPGRTPWPEPCWRNSCIAP